MRLNFDITTDEYEIINDILCKYLSDITVYLFGSRVKNTSRFNSDLDIALEGSKKIDKGILIDLKEEFNDSDLSYGVDIVDLHNIDENFKQIIDEQKVKFSLKRKIPKLRFKEFSGDWEERKLKDLTKINQGLQIPISERYTQKVENSYFYITNEFLKVSSTNKYFIKNPPESVICDEEDILMTRTGNTGQVVTNVIGAFHNNFFKIKYSEFLNKDFLVEFLRLSSTQNMILRYAGASTIPDLNHGDFYRLKLNLPSKQEQEKIASFLKQINMKIEQLLRKEELLNQYKKGVMQKIFSGEIRFKSDDESEFSEWEEKNFGEVFKRITKKNSENNKNVLTISAQYGLINQEKFFNKSVSAKDVSGYYLLENGDFAYNKSYSNGYPMGAIKRLNNYDKGVVSTLYICFRIDSEYDSSFYEKYFDSGFLNKELHKIAQEGARNHGLLNISVVEFFNDIKIPVPSIKEQNKIANFLSSIDKKIEQVSNQLKQTKEFKKSLLQQMFV